MSWLRRARRPAVRLSWSLANTRSPAFVLDFEKPGTAAQVWDAIATANGIGSWFLETDLEERVGGAIVTHMGEDASSPGTVTGWEPQRRVAYEEPGWASLAQHEGADVTPLATEFLVEAQSGGTCVVRVVSSAFGTGADWEGEFFAEMEKMWRPFFDRLRLYLSHFPGQTVTRMEVESSFPGGPEPMWAAMRQGLGVNGVGDELSIRDIRGVVESVDDVQLLVRLTAPVPGLLAFVASRVARTRPAPPCTDTSSLRTQPRSWSGSVRRGSRGSRASHCEPAEHR